MLCSLLKTRSQKTLLGTLMFCLLGVGQGFAANCAANYEPPENLVWDGSTKTEPCTIGGYYIIDNAAKLAWYGANYNKGNAKLAVDVNLGGHLWIPLAAGKGDKHYEKIFDGQNHIIKNLYVNGDELAAINKEYAQNLGFVGVLGGGKVLNLILENVDIQASTNAGTIINNQDNQISVGAVVGWMSDKGSSVVDNCITSGTIKTTGNSQGVGGIVGNAKKGTISNCMSLVEIQTSGSKAYIGGIIGITKTDVTVSSCIYAGPGLTNTGTEGAVGGIAGNVWSGKMSANDSFFEGEGITYGGQPVSGVGKRCDGCTVSDSTVLNTSEINEDSIACALNGIDTTTGACKTEPWSVGETSLSLNGYGADGYKIVFDANGGVFGNGKSSKNKFLDGGMAIAADEVENPTRENFSFAGWAKTRDSAVPAVNLGTVSKSDTVFAVWTPVYTVTFNVAPGVFPESNESEKTKQVISGETITVEGLGTLPTSRCKVYVSGSDDECETWSYFTGWALTAGAHESDSVSLDTVPASDELVLYAVWTDVETYTVTYNANQHGKTTVDYVRVGAGDTVSAPTDPIADDGYVFAGWFTDADGVNPYQFAAQIHESIVLYAKWTLKRFDISYVMNNEDAVNGDNPSSYTIDTSFALKAPTDIEGYVFEGWFYDANFTNKATQVIQGTTGDKTFYAKWSKKKYRVMYLADNNSYGSISDQFVEHGTAITLESAGIFRRAGYEQNGWSITMGGAKGYELGEEYTVVAPVTLYPSWSLATYTITYVCDGCVDNTGNKTSYTVETPTFSVTFTKITPPEGYKMVGWYSATDYITKVQQIKKGAYGDTTLYAKLNKIYHITYVLNGSADDRNKDDYTVDDNTYTLNAPAPVEGYTFAGWFDNAEFEGDAVTEIPQGSTGDMTLYAKWVPISYTITYELNGGTNAEGNPKSYTIEDLPIDLLDPVKTGYEFDGWYYNSDFSGDQVSGIYTLGSDVDVTLYAKWEKVYPFLVNDFGAIKVYQDENGKLTAELDGASSGSVDVISDEDNVVVDKVVLNRTFTVNETSSDQKYATIVLPFTIDQNKISGAEFFEFVDVDLDKNQVSFCNAFDGTHTQLVANTPYIVRATAANITFNLAEGETVKLNTSEMNNPVRGTTSKWEFRGTYSYKKWEEGDPELGSVYGYTAKAKYDYAVGQFAKNGAGAFVRPFRANLFKLANQQARRYMLAKSSVALNSASIGEETVPSSLDVVIVDRETEQTTAIGKLNTATGEIKIIDNWFDMKGRKLNGKPTTKGIYYYNGKRVMVK